MIWITKIISVKPYKITCLWNDGETRVTDLEKYIKEKGKDSSSSLFQLNDKVRFKEAKCDGTTVYWENGIKFIDYDGSVKPGQLDIAPEVLYDLSKVITNKRKSRV